MLKENSFAVFVVGEVRDENGFYKNFVGDTIRAFIDGGMKYYNDIILYNVIGSLSVRVSKQFEPYRKIGKLHQNILVFFKGDTNKIKPMDMKANEFKPLTSLKIEKIERDEQTGEVKEKVNELLCDICGYLAPHKEEFEAHLKRRNHMERIEQLEAEGKL